MKLQTSHFVLKTPLPVARQSTQINSLAGAEENSKYRHRSVNNSSVSSNSTVTPQNSPLQRNSCVNVILCLFTRVIWHKGYQRRDRSSLSPWDNRAVTVAETPCCHCHVPTFTFGSTGAVTCCRYCILFATHLRAIPILPVSKIYRF